MHDRFQKRLNKLRRLVKKQGAAGILITDFVNVTYLTGFTGDDSYLIVRKDGETIISDSRYTEQLETECPELDVYCRGTGESMLAAIEGRLSSLSDQNVAVEADSMSLGFAEQLRTQVENVNFVSTCALVESLRTIKDKWEIASIRESIDMAQRAFAVLRASLRGNQTEKEITANLEHTIRQFGGQGCAFAPIVAVGSRAALPHASPTDRRVDEASFILVDWGAQAGLYLSDLTRVLVTGKISPKLKEIYGVVLKAQLAAIKQIKPGAIMRDVDAAARTTIADAGYGKQFGHGLGHGFGLQIHESPRLSVTSDAPLEAGMVITVEPGIYLPGWGGVRIEDDVLVTRDGHEVLSSVPKSFEDCIVG